MKLDSLDQERPSTTIYVPFDQLASTQESNFNSFPMTLVVRTATAPGSMVSAVTNAIHEVDGTLAPFFLASERPIAMDCPFPVRSPS